VTEFLVTSSEFRVPSHKNPQLATRYPELIKAGPLSDGRFALVSYRHSTRRWNARDYEGPAKLAGVLIRLLRMDTFYIHTTTAEMLEDYDFIVVIYNIAPDLPAFLDELKAKTRARIVLLLDGDCETINWWSKNRVPVFLDWLAKADLVFTFCEAHARYFSLFASAPVVSLNCPLTVDEIANLTRPAEKREKRVLVSGPLFREYNGLTALYVALEAGWPVDVLSSQKYSPEVLQLPETVAFYQEVARETGREINLLPYLPWHPDYLTHAAKYYLAVNMDFRTHAGLFSAELAALGIPVVGSDSLDLQSRFFPGLTFNPFDGKRARAALQKLIADPEFYRRVSRQAATAAREYSNVPQVMEIVAGAFAALL